VDSDYEADEESSSEEDLDSDVEEEKELKPPPTRLILEYESLKKCMEKNCRCPRCDGPGKCGNESMCCDRLSMYSDSHESTACSLETTGLLVGKVSTGFVNKDRDS
jgi:hypothetical protein